MKLRIGHIELFVSDPIKSKRFYERVLGFEVVAEQGEQFVWVKAGEMEILLRQGKPPQSTSSYAQAGAGIVLYTEDLPAKLSDYQQRGLKIQPMPDEPDCYVFTDPDGHWFQLVDPGDQQ